MESDALAVLRPARIGFESSEAGEPMWGAASGRDYPEMSLFRDFGCYYIPSADHVSAREWLLELQARARDEALKRAPTS